MVGGTVSRVTSTGVRISQYSHKSTQLRHLIRPPRRWIGPKYVVDNTTSPTPVGLSKITEVMSRQGVVGETPTAKPSFVVRT